MNPVFTGLCKLLPNLRRLLTNPTANGPVSVRAVSVALGPAVFFGCTAYYLCSPLQHHHTCHSGAKWRQHNNIRWPWQYLESTSSNNLTLTCHRGFISLKATHTFTFFFFLIGIFLFPSPFWKKAWGGLGRRKKEREEQAHELATVKKFVCLFYPPFEQVKVMNVV